MQEESNWIMRLWEATHGYIMFMALAIWGGTVNYISKTKQKDKEFSWAELLGEWTISGFAGMLIALIGAEMQWSVYITCFMAGMAGHMGGRALFIFELVFKSRLGVKNDK